MIKIVWNDMVIAPRDGTFIWGEVAPGWIAYMHWTGIEWRGAGERGLLYREPSRWSSCTAAAISDPHGSGA